jgi:hypothetical protein
MWTAEKPTKPGWYWFRTREEDTIHGEREELGGHMKVVWSDGRSKRVIDMAGEWQGPHEPR